jgi:elongation factor P
MVLMLNGAPHVIEDAYTVGTAKTKHKLHTRLRNLQTGRSEERVFAENERIPVTDMQQRQAQFSYAERDRYVFLDTGTYEELMLSRDQIGERRWFMRENEEYRALFLEGRLLDVVLPEHVALRVVETAAPQRASQQSTQKPAKLDGGLEIMVPLFIAPGDMIKVDTRTRKYLGKESA